MNKSMALMLIMMVMVTVMVIGSVFSLTTMLQQTSYQQKRENVITSMMVAIDQEIRAGNYKCCIDPPCTMCFLGHWLWDDGICRCDDMIAKGEFDKVCPQCVRGIEEGQCKSTEVEFCEINLG